MTLFEQYQRVSMFDLDPWSTTAIESSSFHGEKQQTAQHWKKVERERLGKLFSRTERQKRIKGLLERDFEALTNISKALELLSFDDRIAVIFKHKNGIDKFDIGGYFRFVDEQTALIYWSPFEIAAENGIIHFALSNRMKFYYKKWKQNEVQCILVHKSVWRRIKKRY